MTSDVQSGPRIEITPRSALTDVPVSVQLVGFAPHQQVTVRARTRDDDFGRAWQSWAVFETGGTGSVDTAAHRPLDGTYEDADAMGLFWSMELDPAAENECYFRKRTLDPVHVTFDAHGLPYGPTYVRAPASGLVLAFGGNALHNATANSDSWRRVLSFLAASLRT